MDRPATDRYLMLIDWRITNLFAPFACSAYGVRPMAMGAVPGSIRLAGRLGGPTWTTITSKAKDRPARRHWYVRLLIVSIQPSFALFGEKIPPTHHEPIMNTTCKSETTGKNTTHCICNHEIA